IRDGHVTGVQTCALPISPDAGNPHVRFDVVLFPLPAHRTGRADFPHPALGESSRFCPRKASGPFCKTDQPKHFVEGYRWELFLPWPPHFMLDAQPLTQPLAGVLIHRPVGFADWAEAEVVRPSI